MTTLEKWILSACEVLELNVDFGFSLDVGEGHEIRAIARVRNVGSTNGMLVVSHYEEVRPFADAINRAGYGYAVLDEPRPDERFDLESFKEMFGDWGWFGSDAQRPRWLK